MNDDAQCEQTMPGLGQIQAPMPPMPNQAIGLGHGYPVVIEKAMNGYTVKVGCKTVVFETREKMLSELDRYFKNPRQVEKEYLSKEGR